MFVFKGAYLVCLALWPMKRLTRIDKVSFFTVKQKMVRWLKVDGVSSGFRGFRESLKVGIHKLKGFKLMVSWTFS